MSSILQTRQIASFALDIAYEDIGEKNTEQLKRHLLDAIGSLIYAVTAPSVQKLIRQYAILGEGGFCKVPMVKNLPYDRAAQFFTALIRYPDFMDNFLGKEATCHPSDNIGSLLSLSQYKPVTGKEFLTAMAAGYQVQCRLIQELPVMKKGIDHTVLLAYSVMAAIARLIGLSVEQTAHALGMAGCSINSMVTSRASYTYEWKGFASSLDALDCVNIALLAEQGMTGPIAIFEGSKGVKDVFDMELDYDWSKENFELIQKCILKKYNAEVHAQSALDAVLELKEQHHILAENIKNVEITTFLTAYHIIGSGAYGDRKNVMSKEQADHSLFYLAAVALLDGQVYPEQFEPERINNGDVQQLLKKISVNTKFPLHKPLMIAGLLDPYTQAYPEKMKASVDITLHDGKTFTCEKEDYHGFFTRPFTWEDTIDKFKRLSANTVTEEKQEQIITTIINLDKESSMDNITDVLASIQGKKRTAPENIVAPSV
jgi:2-methylcitrate dehydratase